MQRIPPFRTLDALRGFAALWVVMDHSCDRFLASDNLRFASQPLYAFSIKGQLGVLIFFVISGYCITAAAHGALYSGKTLGQYFFERGRRIFPPYWIALAAGLAAQLLIGLAESHHWIAKINHVTPIETTPIYWLANLTLTQYEWGTGFANIVFWSLCYEIAFYVVIGVCLFAAKRVAASRNMAAGQLTLILGLAGFTFASLLMLTVLSARIFPFSMWHLFAAGGLLFYLLESNQQTVAGYSPRLRWTLNGIAFITVALCVVFIVLRKFGQSDAGHFTSDIQTAGCLIFCLFLALIRRFDSAIEKSLWIRPFVWLGACSYSLYLIHPVVLPFIDVTARKIGFNGSRYWVAFLIQVAIAVMVGRLFYYIVERHFVSSRQIKRLTEEHVA